MFSKCDPDSCWDTTFTFLPFSIKYGYEFSLVPMDVNEFFLSKVQFLTMLSVSSCEILPTLTYKR